MNHKVIFDRILVKRDAEEEDSTILVPEDVKKMPKTGTVVGIGPEVKYVKEDDRVTFNEYAGYFVHTTQDLAEPDLISMREDEVLTIIESEDEESG